jgi:hypothetical protein
MGAKPNDFLIGIGEFVGILLPGSAIAYVLLPALNRLAKEYGLTQLHGTALWVAVAIISYLAGHLVFLIGSFLDSPYDWIRQRWHPREDDVTYQLATDWRSVVSGREAREQTRTNSRRHSWHSSMRPRMARSSNWKLTRSFFAAWLFSPSVGPL